MKLAEKIFANSGGQRSIRDSSGITVSSVLKKVSISGLTLGAIQVGGNGADLTFDLHNGFVRSNSPSQYQRPAVQDISRRYRILR